jgi:hypothetical protein
MKRFIGVLLSLTAGVVMVIMFSNTASAFEIGARAYYWYPTVRADMKVDGSGSSGTEFNPKDMFGMGTKGYPSLEVFGGLGRQHVSIMYTQIDYSGTATLSSPIIFNGVTFAAGTSVDSSWKIRMLDAAYKFDVIDMSNVLAGFSISAIAKLKYIDADSSMSNSIVGQTSNNFKLPVPMIGAAAHIGILANILEARAEITGIAYSGNYLYEALADVSLTPFPFLDIHAGYKIITLRIDHSDTYFNGRFAGPYAALTVSF